VIHYPEDFQGLEGGSVAALGGGGGARGRGSYECGGNGQIAGDRRERGREGDRRRDVRPPGSSARRQTTEFELGKGGGGGVGRASRHRERGREVRGDAKPHHRKRHRQDEAAGGIEMAGNGDMGLPIHPPPQTDLRQQIEAARRERG